MKYLTYITILLLSITLTAQAQIDSSGRSQTGKVKLVSKKGVNILPERDEICLGIDAYPIFNYIGGIFSQNHAVTPSIDYGNGYYSSYGIYVKYMLASDMAVRAKFRANISSTSEIYPVAKSTLNYDPAAPEYVEDEVRDNNQSIYVSVGIEKRRGKSRVQGIYGVEALVGYNKSKDIYVYGNSITNEFNTPLTYDNSETYSGAERIINDYYDKGLFAGVRGFIGIEYFIAPKISIGGEFGYSLRYVWDQNRIREYQYWDSGTQSVATVYRESTRTNDPGSNDVALGIDAMDGSINLYFYF